LATEPSNLLKSLVYEHNIVTFQKIDNSDKRILKRLLFQENVTLFFEEKISINETSMSVKTGLFFFFGCLMGGVRSGQVRLSKRGEVK